MKLKIAISTILLASISTYAGTAEGYIWNDKNGNNIRDKNEGLSGIDLKLTREEKKSYKKSTTTDKNGHYKFRGLHSKMHHKITILNSQVSTKFLSASEIRDYDIKFQPQNNNENIIELTSGVKEEGYSIKKGQWSYYKIDVSDKDRVTTTLSDLNNDADLYVKIGSKPLSTKHNDCDSSHGGTKTDLCSLKATEDTTIYIGVYGYRTTDYSIRADVKQKSEYPPDREFKEIPTKSGVAQPNYLKSYKDPIFHSKVTRITNRENQQSDYGNFPVKTKQGTAWNSDMTMLRLKYRLYDAKTFKELSVTSGESKNSAYRILGSPRYGAGDIRWSKRDPNLMYLLNSSKKFVSIRVNSRKSRISLEKSFIDLSKYEDVSIGHGEGNLAYKDRYILFSAKKYHDDNVYALLYHIGDKRVKWERKVPHTRWSAKSGKRGYFDWITVDPLSKYIVASMNKKMYLYDMNLKHEKVFANTASHGDLGVDINGDPTYVQFVFDGERGIWSYNLRTLAKTKLLPKKYGGGHISCRNYQRQGWCYLSTSKEGYREIIALKLDDGTGTVERFVQTRTHHDHHDLTEVNVSPDGTKVLFSSDWGDKDNILELYHASYP